ncbi:hypothetical protein [Streptomyces clavuligerus]|nr:hypothetical protein [Streptomyces clavuligerus]WDN56364.1 hypothetical protein LL058_31430 [Streptomyces clavuligerus]
MDADQLAALEASARSGLRLVPECVTAQQPGADVELVQHPDGSADAVARVVCDSEFCAAVAQRCTRDAGEDVEAEATRVWAAGILTPRTADGSADHSVVTWQSVPYPPGQWWGKSAYEASPAP